MGEGRRTVLTRGKLGRGQNEANGRSTTWHARVRERKPGRQTTPRSCGLQGLAPSGCPFEPGVTGTRRYSHGVVLLQGRSSCVRLDDGNVEHRLRCRRAPEGPRDVSDPHHPRMMLAPRLQGTASACPDPTAFTPGSALVEFLTFQSRKNPTKRPTGRTRQGVLGLWELCLPEEITPCSGSGFHLLRPLLTLASATLSNTM